MAVTHSCVLVESLTEENKRDNGAQLSIDTVPKYDVGLWVYDVRVQVYHIKNNHEFNWLCALVEI